MKTLTITEIEMVNGAGANGELGKKMGMAIGSVVDVAISIFGAKSDFNGAIGDLGLGIGLLLDLDLVTAGTKIISGVTSLISAFGKDSTSPFLKIEA